MQRLTNSFEVFSPDIDETISHSESPKDVVKRLSLLKAKKAYEIYANCFILSADTVVYCRRKILDKTVSREIAHNNISKLSGRRHQVFTGITFINNKGHIYYLLSRTIIKFKLLNKREIEHYLNLNEWQDCAGSYSIQGFAETFVNFQSGSYSSVIGLPLNKVYRLLKKYNLVS